MKGTFVIHVKYILFFPWYLLILAHESHLIFRNLEENGLSITLTKTNL